MKLVKKLLVISLCLVMVFALAACGGAPDTTDDNAANAEPITIRIAHTEPSVGTINQACEEFKSWIEEASAGGITVELYPDGSISGSDADLAEAAATGTIEFSVSATSALTNYSDKFGMLDMPFLFDDEQAAFNAVDGDFGAALNSTLSGTGLTILGYSFNGVRETTNNVRPITQPDDFKGIKMRAMQSPTHIGMYEAYGANATPMSFGEVYTGLQQGTVEGQDNPVDVIYNQQFQEVQKYLSLTIHIHGFIAILANERWYNSLSEESRALVYQGIKEC
ncbi:MAG: TRAP transporter substrate-binding protein, partial [Clostridia bacterium]|nr:TRAP transporter substrate-binding protein [Clostridia bacterium]